MRRRFEELLEVVVTSRIWAWIGEGLLRILFFRRTISALREILLLEERSGGSSSRRMRSRVTTTKPIEPIEELAIDFNLDGTAIVIV